MIDPLSIMPFLLKKRHYNFEKHLKIKKMKVHPYLNFDGKSEEAFMFYKSVFGGEFSANMKMSEMPEGDKLPKEEQNRTMHIALPIGEGTLLMATDIVPSAGHKMVFGNQTHIMLSPETKEEAYFWSFATPSRRAVP